MGIEYGCYGPDGRALGVAPLYHGAGFAFSVAPIFFGGSCVILPRFDPEEVLYQLSHLGITNVFLVPTHFNGIFGLGDETLRKYDTSGLETIISNAAPLPQATKIRIVEHFGEGRLFECYGSTEASIVSNLRPPDQLRKEQCVGQTFPCTAIRLLRPRRRGCPGWRSRRVVQPLTISVRRLLESAGGNRGGPPRRLVQRG